MATAAHARRLGASRDDPSAAPTSGRSQFDLSSGAATAVVFLSIILCFILLCTYCRCARQRAMAAARGGRAMRHGFPSALLRPADGAALPVVCYADAGAGAKKGQQPEGDCPVCLEAFGDDDGVKVVPACGHVFHAPCIDRWLDVRNSCPVCRCVVVCHYADRAGPGASDDADDQEIVLERVVAMIEAIREEEAAARRAPATARVRG
ncbi:RING-H2 finger protein ATL39 [Aegilops tauschii subsp. strangulata]|uniref:RING-type E3 ubiquitin transferase n=2 Tax=Aegilops tauschii subsp. strangulata TaxID=200361 RepID=A0A452YT81_AEGTS|nr:RING-H2 finger protein ATL39 [Aegilops tauschii subsp. strangulata]XP_020200345.1 RING-H2 finger protein ATL39 [Aegilops tauschii subsp. strangulata]XP_020200346.1 RING-H2 finger protein ATL39 [Aegilops tauschii subsp. strangulata]